VSAERRLILGRRRINPAAQIQRDQARRYLI
jgi:hypothetical protein